MKQLIISVLIVVLLVIFYPYFIEKTGFAINKISDLLLFFITINSILCGFSTNNESKILSIVSNKKIEKLQGSGIIKEREYLVLINFIISVITILTSSLLYLLIMINVFNNVNILKTIVYILIILTSIGVYLFIKSSHKIRKLIKLLYDDRYSYSKEEQKKIKNET